MLQTLSPNEPYDYSEPASGGDNTQSPSFGHYLDILKRRFFYFLLPFGVISVIGLCLTAIFLKPSYLSEAKISLETQIAPDLVGTSAAASSTERIQRIQQRILTRDNLVSIANKFGLFANRSGRLDLMRESSHITPIEVIGQPRQSIAFTVGFEYETPELAMRVANDFVTLIMNEDERTRAGRSAEAVKILGGEVKGIEDKLEATQMQILEVARRPRDALTDASEKENPQLTALTALKAELIQKASVYSEAHPAVIALKKRIAAMEKSLAQLPQTQRGAKSTLIDDIETLKRQREALEKRLADANSKLATARLNEKLDRDQQSERLQIIESPSLPQKPLKSNSLKFIAVVFAAAAALGMGSVTAAELFDNSIRGRHQLLGVVASPLVVSIPYITTNADTFRARWKITLSAISAVLLAVVLCALAAAVVLHLPLDPSRLHEVGIQILGAGQ